MREMKHSGIEWIGEIPIEWTVKKFKYVANLYTGNSIKDEEKSLYEDSKDAVPYIATKDIKLVFNTVDYENGLYVKNNDLSFVRAYRGDILMCIEGGSAGKKKAKLDRTVCFVNKLCCFHATDIYSNFLYYIINSPNFEEEFIFNITGLIGGVSKNKLMNFVLPFPPYIEQHHIADVLDEKCAKIDAVIAKQQQVIEKLKEYKLSVITEAVTKGLAPTVPMKDSGVECIQNIPANWKNVRLKFLLTQLVDCPHETPIYSSDGEYFVIRTADQDVAELRSDENMYRLSKNEYQSRIRRLSLDKDDIVYGREGGRWGFACRVPASEKYCLGQRMLQFRCDTDIFLPEFAVFALSSKNIYLQGSVDTLGSASPHVNISTVQNYWIPLPPIEDQKIIASNILKKCKIIDEQINKKEKLIKKLFEYKKSLIYEVVTGKKEV